jgi:hypothetical protein
VKANRYYWRFRTRPDKPWPVSPDVHNRTDASGPIREDRHHHPHGCRPITTMLFTTAFLVAVSAALILHKARAAGRRVQTNLGWMSPQWLAEHRSSHPS